MYEVLCEHCWRTEAVEGDGTGDRPEHPCPGCGAENAWLGPYATIERMKRPSDSWPVLTSPLYVHAGQPDRRVRDR